MAQLEKQWAALVTAHQENFPVAGRPIAPPPEPVNRDQMIRDFERRAISSISPFKRSERRAARANAALAADQAVEAEESSREAARAEQQGALDEVWMRLTSNDAPEVIAAIEAAFEDNQSPAAPLNVDGAEVLIAVSIPPRDAVVPEQEVTETPHGKPTLKRRSQTDRNTFYWGLLLSQVLATVKEAFAVAPAISGATVVAAARDNSARLVPLYVKSFSRQQFEGVNWDGSGEDSPLLIADTGAFFNRAGRTKEVMPLELGQHPELRGLMAQLSTGLQGSATQRAQDGPVDQELSSLSSLERKVAMPPGSVPSILRDKKPTFAAWQRERADLERDFSEASDGEARYLLAILIANVLKFEFEEVSELISEMASGSVQPSEEFVDWVKPWVPWVEAEIERFQSISRPFSDKLTPAEEETLHEQLDARLEPMKERVKEVLQGRINELREYIDTETDVALPAADQGTAKGLQDDIPEQIRRLAALHDEGILTDDEFSSKKADLLDRL